MPDIVDVEGDVLKLRSEIDRLNKEAVEKRAAADKLRQDMADSGVNLSSLHEDDVDAFEKIDEAYKEADLRVDQVCELRKRLERTFGWTGRANGAGGAGTGPAGGGPGAGPGLARRTTVGRRIVESEAYQTVKRSGAASMAEAQVRMGPATAYTRDEFKDLIRQRAGLDLTSGQAMVTPEFSLIPPVELPVRQVRLIDLINVETTDSDAVVWTRQTVRTLAAAPTATGVNAPQATLAFERVTNNVRRIPVLLTAPKEVLADEGRVQGILDRQLMTDARLTVEAQVLNGNGSGENFDGILHTGSIGSLAQGDVADEYALDAIHRGITYVRLHLFEDPDAIGLHPVDLEKIILQKDLQGRYIFSPTEDQASIWGFPAVATPVFTAGTGLVGNFRMGATMWLREDVVITATDGYTDVPSGVNYFSAGLVAILAQIRAAFAVERPFAFCEVSSLASVTP
jgi:HK97 family phage major capsid protein